MTVEYVIKEAEYAKPVDTGLGPAILLGDQVLTIDGPQGTDWTAIMIEALRTLGARPAAE